MSLGRATLRRRLRALALRGDAVECPCCGGRFRRFLDAGERFDRLCPRCGSRDRHRALWLYLRERMGIERADRIRLLHFAPENALSRRLSGLRGVDYTTADLDPRAAMVAADITSLPFDDGSFDAILCIHVLEHVDDDRAAMRELCRVLAPGGWAIVMVPLDLDRAETYEDSSITTPDARREAFWQSDHVRLYGRDLADRLRASGFEVEVDDWVRQLPASVIERCGLFPQEDMYVCR